MPRPVPPRRGTQIAILKGAMWSTRTPAPALLDLAAYTGYKYFGYGVRHPTPGQASVLTMLLDLAAPRLTINTVMGMLGGPLVYYVVLLATGGTMAFFMYKTLAFGCDMRVGTQGNYLAIGYVAHDSAPSRVRCCSVLTCTCDCIGWSAQGCGVAARRDVVAWLQRRPVGGVALPARESKAS